MSRSFASELLLEELKAWRKDHPHGFSAAPAKVGKVNLMVWQCTIPGMPNTDWEGGSFPITMHFSEDYPVVPPNCTFPPDFFHPNVEPSGRICLSTLDATNGSEGSISVKQILVDIQHLLNNPNLVVTAAQPECSHILFTQPGEYRRRVIEQASRFPFRK